MKGLLAITALTGAISCGSALAQDETPRTNRDTTLELTMALMPTNATTADAVTSIIELPNELSDGKSSHGAKHSAHGLDTANRAREDGRGFGKDAAAAARDNREAAGRAAHGADKPPPPAPPELPDRPALPSR